MDLGLLYLRIALGIIFLIHGEEKLHLWREKAPKHMNYLLFNQLRVASLLEIAGGLFVLLGKFTRLGALMLVVVMLGALYYKIVVWKTPFSKKDGMGWEFDLILLAASLLILYVGGGNFSLGAYIRF